MNTDTQTDRTPIVSVRDLRVEEPGLDDVYEHILGLAS